MSDLTLTSRKTVRDLLATFGVSADKALGQNFLVDAHALGAIVAAAEIAPTDTVLEVGPGLGTLTVELAEQAYSVVALEFDARLLPILTLTLESADNVEVRNVDALAFDFTSFPADSLLVANLPYNIATAVVTRALESMAFKRLVCLLQREVAERLVARPGTGAFSSLSLLVQHFGHPRLVRHLAAGSFAPEPAVASSLIRIDTVSRAQPEPELFAFIRLIFAHRRKTLAKNLQLAGYARERVAEALRNLHLDPRVRGEALDLDTFRQLADRLLPRP